MAAEYARTRERVDDLLRQCADAKLIRHRGANAAAKLAEEAYALARGDRALLRLRRLAAYRLAHLTLRSSCDTRALARVDELFQESGGGPERHDDDGDEGFLGPLPELYRLAVLRRRSETSATPGDREALGRDLAAAFERARRRVEAARLRDGRDAALGGAVPGPLQDGAFNMLELAAYFLGHDYAGLDGLGALDVLEPDRTEAWLLVGPDPAISSALRAESLASAELTALGRAHPDAVLIRRPRRSATAWRLGGGDAWLDANDDWVHLLARVLHNPETDKAALRRLVADDDHAALRQAMKRATEAMRRLTGRPGLTVFKPNRDQVRLTGEVTIYGAVHAATLGRRRRASS